MMILLGDEVTVLREIGEDITWVTGRVTGIVQNNEGALKYFYIKGVDSSFWMNEGWKFQEEVEDDEDA
jgi:hypothetical protein